MISPLSMNSGMNGITAPAAPSLAATGAPVGFQDMLLEALKSTQESSNQSQTAVQQNLIGDELSLVESFTAMREADLAIKLTMQIRNKLMDAYNEIQQMRF